jgi:hypothetical protein
MGRPDTLHADSYLARPCVTPAHHRSEGETLGRSESAHVSPASSMGPPFGVFCHEHADRQATRHLLFNNCYGDYRSCQSWNQGPRSSTGSGSATADAEAGFVAQPQPGSRSPDHPFWGDIYRMRLGRFGAVSARTNGNASGVGGRRHRPAPAGTFAHRQQVQGSLQDEPLDGLRALASCGGACRKNHSRNSAPTATNGQTREIEPFGITTVFAMVKSARDLPNP